MTVSIPALERRGRCARRSRSIPQGLPLGDEGFRGNLGVGDLGFRDLGCRVEGLGISGFRSNLGFRDLET